MTKANSAANKLIGEYKTFGPAGPAYCVMEPLRPLAGGDWMMKVQVLESGEVLEYGAVDIAKDPKAD